MCTIENLVLKIQKGEGEEAFVLLEEKIKPLMYTMYYRHFYYCIELEDFIQEATYLLFYTANKFDLNKGKVFISYYKRSLKNYAIQLIRHEHRERVIPGSCLCKSDISNIKYHVSVEDEFLLREEIPKYWKSLSTLERDVLYFYTKGYSFEEISLKLEKSVAGTKSALNRCHKKFKIFYNKIQEDKMK